MADYLLDTNVIIDYLRGDPVKVALLQKYVSMGSLIYSCEITVAEIFSGMRESEREDTESFLNTLYYAPIDQSTAKNAGEFRKIYRAKGKQITLADALITSVAITHNLILLTDNIKDYPMPELKKEKPL